MLLLLLHCLQHCPGHITGSAIKSTAAAFAMTIMHCQSQQPHAHPALQHKLRQT
jgi:hypothetical protein